MGRISKIVGALLFTYGVLTGISMLFVPDSIYNQYYLYYMGQTSIFILLGIFLFKRGGRKKQGDEDTATASVKKKDTS
ncbi:MAG: hypothetical protein HYY22_01835 [Thaumarchaeota archaeon]|nr:hypothetical protein [Nitrososphaerota archaeon]